MSITLTIVIKIEAKMLERDESCILVINFTKLSDMSNVVCLQVNAIVNPNVIVTNSLTCL